MIGRLGRWWFEPAPASRLAILRIAVGAYGLYLFWSHHRAYASVARQAASRFAPVGPAVVFPAPIEPALFDAWMYGTVGLLVLFVLGVGHRVLAPVLAVSLCTLLAYRTSWQKIYHSDNLFTLQLMILAFAPAASALSVDALVARRWPGLRALSWTRWPATEGPIDAAYGWPIRLICTVTTLTYLLAGLAKVGGEAGWRWATADNLLDQIGKNAIQKELLTDEGVSSTVRLAYELGDWLGPLAVIALAVELLAPLALVDRRLGRLWCVGTWCMHLGIHVLMDILFLYPATGIAFLGFFRPERWLDALRSVLDGTTRSQARGLEQSRLHFRSGGPPPEPPATGVRTPASPRHSER